MRVFSLNIIIIIMSRHQYRCPSSPFSIIHRFRSVFKGTSCIGIELLYVGSS